MVVSVYITPTNYHDFLHSTCTHKASRDPSFPVCDTESDLHRGWLGLASLVPAPHLAHISLARY